MKGEYAIVRFSEVLGFKYFDRRAAHGQLLKGGGGEREGESYTYV
jgi:hypothetical protein